MLTRSLFFKLFDSADSFAHLFLWQFWNITFDLVAHGNVPLISPLLTFSLFASEAAYHVLWDLWVAMMFEWDVDFPLWCSWIPGIGIPMLLSPEISTLENCKRSKSVWRFYQSKRIILRIRQWYSSMMFYDSGDVVPFTPTQGIWPSMELWCSEPSACPVEICRVGPFQWKGWLIILNDT